jgi:hypothetical protein
VTIDPLADLIGGVSYFVTIHQGAIHDLAGNAFNGISSSQTFNFSTPPDSTAPLLIDTFPDDDAVDVAPELPIASAVQRQNDNNTLGHESVHAQLRKRVEGCRSLACAR